MYPIDLEGGEHYSNGALNLLVSHLKFLLNLTEKNDALSWIKRSYRIGTGIGVFWRLRCRGLDDESNRSLVGFENKKRKVFDDALFLCPTSFDVDRNWTVS